MKIENIIKKLEKENVKVYIGEFDFTPCMMAEGTALIDLIDGEVRGTSARWVDVVEQIVNHKSHIQTIEGKSKELTKNKKMGF